MLSVIAFAEYTHTPLLRGSGSRPDGYGTGVLVVGGSGGRERFGDSLNGAASATRIADN